MGSTPLSVAAGDSTKFKEVGVNWKIQWSGETMTHSPRSTSTQLCPLRGPLVARDSGRPLVGDGAREKRQSTMMSKPTEYNDLKFFLLHRLAT